jgi:hypothetical protein
MHVTGVTIAKSVRLRATWLNPRVILDRKKRILSFPKRSQWLRGSFHDGKVAEREAGHYPPSRAEVKNEWIYTSTQNTSLRRVK